MRSKQQILDDLFSHAQKLDPQHSELAAIAMIETEIQIDIRDELAIIKRAFLSISQPVEGSH